MHLRSPGPKSAGLSGRERRWSFAGGNYRAQRAKHSRRYWECGGESLTASQTRKSMVDCRCKTKYIIPFHTNFFPYRNNFMLIGLKGSLSNSFNGCDSGAVLKVSSVLSILWCRLLLFRLNVFWMGAVQKCLYYFLWCLHTNVRGWMLSVGLCVEQWCLTKCYWRLMDDLKLKFSLS